MEEERGAEDVRVFCHLLLRSRTGAQRQLHDFVIPAGANPSPLSPAAPDVPPEVPASGIRHQTRLPDSPECKKPSLGSSCRRYLPSSAKFHLRSCQDFNEQFPQPPSCDETGPSRCTVSSQKRELCLLLACSNSSRYRNRPLWSITRAGKVALFGEEIVAESALLWDVYTVLLRG